MWTLAEAQKRSNDVLEKGIIETIIKESPILARMKFETLKGTAHTYLRETTMPTVDFYSVGDMWNESSGTATQYTCSLKILGGDIDIDNFEVATLSDQNDLLAEAWESKSKALAHAFQDYVIYGDDTSNTKGFDGLHNLVDSNMVVNMGTSTTGAALSMAKLDQMIDLIKPGRPDALIMPRTIARRLRQYYRDGTAGANFTMERGEDGTPMPSYGGIPILVNDFQVMTETIANNTYSAKTGGATGSIFAVRFDSKGFHGYENGGIQKVDVGQLESKDARRLRIKWYVAPALKNIYSLARLDGITDAAATD
jgi:hypothetical protein